MNEDGERVLNTQLFRVYDGKRLVAFSYFDVGRRVMYTKAGIYDPDYADHSLGLFTMLLEVELAVERDFTYYYPGYYAPTFPAFNYKLQFGPMQYRNIATGQWLPHPALPLSPTDEAPEDPLTLNRRMLLEAQRALIGSGHPGGVPGVSFLHRPLPPHPRGRKPDARRPPAAAHRPATTVGVLLRAYLRQ